MEIHDTYIRTRRSAKALGEKLNMSTILAQLLIRRGISTESAAKRFFRPNWATSSTLSL